MAIQRRRRTQPLQRSRSQPVKPKRPGKPVHVDWRETGFRVLIGFFGLINFVLLFFIVRQCATPPMTEEEVIEETRILQVEVLNGCGVPGVATQFTDYLRARGYDVVKTENYETFNILKTVVIDRKGNMKNARRLADALGLSYQRILQEVNEGYLIDASIIVGKDFRSLSRWSDMEQHIE
jgi:hypothetical protein